MFQKIKWISLKNQFQLSGSGYGKCNRLFFNRPVVPNPTQPMMLLKWKRIKKLHTEPGNTPTAAEDEGDEPWTANGGTSASRARATGEE